MYANEIETKEKKKLTEIKNYLQHAHWLLGHDTCVPPSVKIKLVAVTDTILSS